MAVFSTAVKRFAPSVLVALSAPLWVPAVHRALRPVVQGLFKGGVLLSESIKEGASKIGETFSDMAAEAKASTQQESENNEGGA